MKLPKTKMKRIAVEEVAGDHGKVLKFKLTPHKYTKLISVQLCDKNLSLLK